MKTENVPVLKFAGEIAADPRIGTEQRPFAIRPASRDIGKDRQDRKLVVVIPKKQRIVPEEEEAERDDDQAGEERTNKITLRPR